MNRSDIVEILNEYAFDNNIKPVVEYLSITLEKNAYENELDLIFMAIATTQLYVFLSYLTDEEKNFSLIVIIFEAIHIVALKYHSIIADSYHFYMSLI